MAGASRDRVTIDLRGIGDAVRADAVRQGLTVSQLARRALLTSIGPSSEHPPALGSDCPTPTRAVAKLMLRMPRAHAEVLILNAASLGLSYGEYVARLVEGSELPRPSKERDADRAALLASNDKLAALSADLNGFVRLIRGVSGEQAQALRDRLERADGQIRLHLDRASAFIVGMEGTQP
jgi:hypothetical protein